jgi:cell division protein FtsW
LGKRIENFSTDKPDEDDYQIEKAKMLLHLVRFMDLVLEKCSEELLPQSSSDFIYAIIVEEYRWLWCSNFIFIALVSICCSLTTNTLFGS